MKSLWSLCAHVDFLQVLQLPSSIPVVNVRLFVCSRFSSGVRTFLLLCFVHLCCFVINGPRTTVSQRLQTKNFSWKSASVVKWIKRWNWDNLTWTKTIAMKKLVYFLRIGFNVMCEQYPKLLTAAHISLVETKYSCCCTLSCLLSSDHVLVEPCWYKTRPISDIEGIALRLD